MGQGKQGGPRRTWRKQVVERSMMVGVSREDALCLLRHIVGIALIISSLGRIWLRSCFEDTTMFEAVVSFSDSH